MSQNYATTRNGWPTRKRLSLMRRTRPMKMDYDTTSEKQTDSFMNRLFGPSPFTGAINGTLVLAAFAAGVGVYLLLTNDHYYYNFGRYVTTEWRIGRQL